MDRKDRRILYALDGDSRASFKRIGKETKLKPESVRYRVQKNRYVRYFLTVIDGARLGYSYYDIYIKLQNVDSEKKQQLISYYRESPHVTWIADLEGPYDLAMIVMVRNQLELQSFMEDLSERFSPYILKKTVAINLHAEFYRRDYLVGKQREQAPRQLDYRPTAEVVELDEVDGKICRSLADSRTTSVEIGKAAGVSADTVTLRMKRLKQLGVIKGFTIILDNAAAGQLHYKLNLYLVGPNERVRALLAHVRTDSRVIAAVQTLAGWDYEVDLEVESVQQLKDFTMSLTNAFSDVIRDYDTLRVVDMPKYNFFP